MGLPVNLLRIHIMKGQHNVLRDGRVQRQTMWEKDLISL